MVTTPARGQNHYLSKEVNHWLYLIRIISSCKPLASPDDTDSVSRRSGVELLADRGVKAEQLPDVEVGLIP